MATVIAIGGVSRSGKSSLALWLHQQLPKSMMLSQDDFPSLEDQIPKVKGRVDWEHPASINWLLWQRAVSSNMEDCDYLILEGLFMFRPEAEVVAADFSYYLSMEKTDFLIARRKEQRWGKEPEWFIEHVWDSHFEYGLPQKHHHVNRYHKINQADYQTILAQVMK